MSLWQQVDAAQRRRECTLPGGYEEEGEERKGFRFKPPPDSSSETLSGCGCERGPEEEEETTSV